MTVRRAVDVVLRPMVEGDVDDVVAVSIAQDLTWWGEVHGDADDVRAEIDRAISASGSLESGTRVAVVAGAVVGAALHVGHGQTSVFADDARPGAHEAREALVDWLVDTGAEVIDAPAQDAGLLAILAARGLVPTRSSFELERGADLSDLVRDPVPDAVELVTYRPGADDQEVHDTIYSVWTDVPGHTYRPLEEWRSLFVGGERFDPGLVVLARRVSDAGVAGVAIGRVFDDVGWVMQIAVGRPDRSIGLGRALLVEALHRLAATGVERVGLSVEAANATALGLYRSVGLEIAGEWIHCSPPPVPAPR